MLLALLASITLIACDDDVSMPNFDGGAGQDAAVESMPNFDGGAQDAAADAAFASDVAHAVDGSAAGSEDAETFLVEVEPATIQLQPGTCRGLKAKVRRRGYVGQILIGVASLPDKVAFSTGHIPAGADEGDMTLMVRRSAPAVSNHIQRFGFSGGSHNQTIIVNIEVLAAAPPEAGSPAMNQSTISDESCAAFLATGD